MKKSLLFSLMLWVLYTVRIPAQCTPEPVVHISGTQQVGCTSVTVTAQNGSVISSGCPDGSAQAGPYWIGESDPVSSYTFSFSPPIGLLEFDYRAINNYPSGAEEVSFIINGNFYPIPNAGNSIGCSNTGVIVGGYLQAPTNSIAEGNEIIVLENISTITIVNEYISGQPGGTVFALRVCCFSCTTDAGTLNSGPLDPCVNVPATFPDVTGMVLDNNDLLQYILFSNPNDTLGSIIATNNTPTFTFNPATMQTGVTYYVAAIAGNNLNGNVDLNDPCLDISNAAQLIWHPLPEVELQTDNSDVCPGGCRTLTAILTGTPPFTLTVTSPAGTTTVTFQNNTGTFQICPPPGSPPGSFTVQATALTDAWCACP